MTEQSFFKLALKKTLLIFFLFTLIYSTTSLFAYLEHKTKCFPVTVITVEKEHLDELILKVNPCSFSFEMEKMTFDSAIFNHYESLPVKNIYLYYLEIPFTDWQLFSNLDNSIPEANHFLLQTISRYSNSKLKILLLAYIFLFFFGLIFLVKIAPSKKDSTFHFIKTVVFTNTLFIVLSMPIFFLFSSNTLVFAMFVVGTLFIAHLSILTILHRLLFSGETK